MRLDANPHYKRLQQLATSTAKKRITEYFEADLARVQTFSVEGPHLFLDYSKNQISNEIRTQLLDLAQAANLQNRISDLFTGKIVNLTENRPALHTALRNFRNLKLQPDDETIIEHVTSTLEHMKSLSNALDDQSWQGSTGKQITQLISIGIGGSYLGPKVVIEGLKPFHKKDRTTFFVANIDGSDISEVLKQVDAEQCLIVVQSKSFGTLETLKNAQVAIAWLRERLGQQVDISQHLLAVTSNIEKAIAFGVPPDRILPMWDWVGGRYSLWSAIGFPIIFQLGFEHFIELLKGAEEMDDHFATAPYESNLPVLLALVGIWNRTFLKRQALAVIPYDEQLHALPEYLQQLDMESNGKSVSTDGVSLGYDTGPIIFGGAGTNGQHAYHQLFHQGTTVVPIDFILAKKSHYAVRDHHQHLISNCLAQARALMVGKSVAEAEQELLKQGLSEEAAKKLAPHKYIEGNKPSNILLVNTFNPRSLGALIAAYEHKVYVQGVIWGIDSFDQWGVELGKTLESEIFPLISGTGSEIDALDASTAMLIKKLSGN